MLREYSRMILVASYLSTSVSDVMKRVEEPLTETDVSSMNSTLQART